LGLPEEPEALQAPPLRALAQALIIAHRVLEWVKQIMRELTPGNR
jgi:hypothetical protein